MTVAGIIEAYNTEHPNNIDDNQKLQWLKKCEQMIVNEVILPHEHDLEDENEIKLSVKGSTLYVQKAGGIEQHMDSFDMDTELYVKEPYDDVYIYYLDQRIAYNNNDTERYNFAISLYNNAYLTYQQYFNRTYKTIKQPKIFFRHENL